MRSNMIRGYLYIIASALIFGCMPLGAKLIYAEGVNSLSLVFLRNLFALPALAILVKLQGQSLKVSPKALPGVALVAVMGCCVTPLLLYQSYQYIASGTATVFHFIYPAAVVLGGMLFLRERVSWKRLLCVLLCTLGICLFYNPGEPIDLTGAGLALLSGVTYAAYILLLTVFQNKSLSGFRFTFYVAIVCAVVMGLVCLCSGELRFPVSIKGWLLCAVFSLAVCVGAVVLFQQGTLLAGAQRASILSTVEPITSILVGVVAFAEPVNLRTVLGSCMVVLASILIAVFDMREQKKSTK